MESERVSSHLGQFKQYASGLDPFATDDPQVGFRLEVQPIDHGRRGRELLFGQQHVAERQQHLGRLLQNMAVVIHGRGGRRGRRCRRRGGVVRGGRRFHFAHYTRRRRDNVRVRER